jgi:hypothetical protein
MAEKSAFPIPIIMIEIGRLLDSTISSTVLSVSWIAPSVSIKNV